MLLNLATTTASENYTPSMVELPDSKHSKTIFKERGILFDLDCPDLLGVFTFPLEDYILIYIIDILAVESNLV